MNEKLDLMKAVLEDKEFAAKIRDMVDPYEVQSAFAEKGVDLTIEDISTVARTCAALAENGELDAEVLENVSGGVVVDGIVVVCGLIGLGGKAMEAINKERVRNGKKPIW